MRIKSSSMANQKDNVENLIPDDLREALADESETDRRELKDVWRLLGSASARFAVEADDRPATTSASTTRSGIQQTKPGQLDDSWKLIAGQLNLDRTPATPTIAAPARVLSRATNRTPVQAEKRSFAPLRLVSKRTWSSIAASLVLFALGFQWFAPASVTVAPGEQHYFVMADGSAIELNSETSLKYARPLRAFFSSTRLVHLEGEAFFNVQKGSKPFVVASKNASVTVLGTQFNVRSRNVGGVPQTTVAVVEGRVEVDGISGETIELSTGLFAVVESSNAPILGSATPERISQWKEGTLVLIDLPFGDLIDELERRFGATIEVDKDVDSTTRKTAYYPADRALESILSDLCVSQELSYRPTANGFRISR